MGDIKNDWKNMVHDKHSQIPLYEETVRFKAWKFLWYLIAGMSLFTMGFPYLLVFLISRAGENSEPVPWMILLLVASGANILVLLLLGTATLKIQVTSITVTVSSLPFYKKTFLRNELQSFKVITFNSLMDYGGFGVRIVPGGVACVLGGKKGIELRRTNGRFVIVESERVDELRSSLLQAGITETK